VEVGEGKTPVKADTVKQAVILLLRGMDKTSLREISHEINNLLSS